MRRSKFWLGLFGALLLSACVTAPDPVPSEPAEPVAQTPPAAPVPETPAPTLPETPPESGPTEPVIGAIPEIPEPTPSQISPAFSGLKGWAAADMRGALKAFQRSCAIFAKMESGDYIAEKLTEYGRAQDWSGACALAQATPAQDAETARSYFESEFLPVALTISDEPAGLITGYYQPEIQARRVKDAVYSEPILSAPTNPDVLTWDRSQIGEGAARVIAYGRPIEVFFMQIQGSGVMVFADGSRARAAYAANNGKPYTSIGRVLIDRGELTKDQSSKQNIEDWMTKAGPDKARALMNENKRYIFFKSETILPDEGPKGAMQAPLTDMASIAIDPSVYPYGLPVWLETLLPSGKGDYKGAPHSLLAVAQDTGKAIRGEYRADLYFGSGPEAGDKAGVMKHPARWTILLPFHIALAFSPVS